MKEKDVHVKTEYSKSRLRKPFIYGLGGVAWVSAVFAAPVAIVVMDRNKDGGSHGVEQGKVVYSFMNRDYGSVAEAERAVDGVLRPLEVFVVPGIAAEFDSKDDASVAYLRANPSVAAVGDGSGRTYTKRDIDLANVSPAPQFAILGLNHGVRVSSEITSFIQVTNLNPRLAIFEARIDLTSLSVTANAIDDFTAMSFYTDVPFTTKQSESKYFYVLDYLKSDKFGAYAFSTYQKAYAFWLDNYASNLLKTGCADGNVYTQDEIDARDRADQLPKDASAIVGLNSPEKINTLSDADKVVVKQNSKTKVEYGGKVYDDKDAAYKELIISQNK